jgi:thiol-disulfide isomerase/thioredoxin
MKKTLFTVLLISIACILDAQTYFSDDFSNGLTKFSCYDVDGNVPSATYSGIFPTTLPYAAWVKYGSGTDACAISTSIYTPAGTSNDWLVIKDSINVVSDQAVLNWRSRSGYANLLDSYKIYISTTGNKVSDFTSPPLVSTTATYSYTQRTVSLSSYVGQKIYIAFVNCSNAKGILLIDDIFVGNKAYTPTDNTSQNIYTNATAVTAELINTGATITTFSATYTANNKTYSKDFSGLNILPGATYSFSFPDSIHVSSTVENIPYSLEITVGTVIKKLYGSVNWCSFKPVKKVIAEEATGTWCGYCPRGAVYLKSTAIKYPDSFIGIAVHGNDPMAVQNYLNGISTFISGYPSAVVDRKYVADPLKFESLYLSSLKDFTPASIALTGKFTDATKRVIQLTTTSVFNRNYPGNGTFKLAFIVTEDNVKDTAKTYAQPNYFANNALGAMGGFEALPNPVPAAQMSYQEVGRWHSNPFAGVLASLPLRITKEQPIVYQASINVPANVKNIDEVSIIAILLDYSTGQIKNADRIKASTLSITAVEIPKTSALNANVTKTSSAISVEVETTSSGAITGSLFSVDGKQLFTNTVRNLNSYRFIFPYTGLKGVFVVRVQTADGSVERKIVL